MRYTLMLPALAVALLLSAGTLGRSADDKKNAFVPKDLEGWEGLIKEYWSVNDEGALVGKTKEKQGFNTFLCSKKKYKDFELSFKVKMTGTGWEGNSGVQIRSKIHDMKKFAVTGPQCDMGGPYWGSLYGENFGGMMKSAPGEVVKKVKKDDYNDYSIKCVGKHVTIKVNGETAVDEDFNEVKGDDGKVKRMALPDEGIIAFQLHGGPPMEVIFKDIIFKDLSAK